MSRCTRANASPKSLESVKPAAGVGGERRQRVLRRGELHRTAAARRGRRRAPSRGRSPAARRRPAPRPAARAYRPRRSATLRADRGVDRRAQLDLVVVAAPLHAGAEVEDRLLLLDRRQRLGQRLQRAQPDVVVEHVELGVVAASCPRSAAAASSVARCWRWRLGRGAVGVGELAERRATRRPVAGEVGQHREGRADRGHGDQVGRASSARRRTSCAESTARCTSSGCIELTSKSSDDQATSGEHVGRHRHRRRRRRCSSRAGARRVASASCASTSVRAARGVDRLDVGCRRDFLEAEARDLLRPCRPRGPRSPPRSGRGRRARLVADDDVHRDDRCADAEHRRAAAADASQAVPRHVRLATRATTVATPTGQQVPEQRTERRHWRTGAAHWELAAGS